MSPKLSFVNKLVLNLTWAYSQSDFVRNHVGIIPAPVKNIFETPKDWKDSP